MPFHSAAPVAPQKQPPPEVERLQGAIAALGEGNPLSALLQAALRSARTKSKVLPVNERVEACKGFIERAKKRLVRAKAHEQKLIFEAELREGEARLLQLQAESEAQSEGPSVTDWQSKIDQLIQERDTLLNNPPKTALPGVWMADGPPPIAQEIPPMPEDRQDLEGWLSCRNCELRNALEFGDVATVGKVGALVAQGSARMVAFAQDVPMNGQAKSSLMSVLNQREEEVHRGNTDGGESGLRLGEASNPGPPGRRVRDSAKEILNSLERELTSIESDDEPFGLGQAGTQFRGFMPESPVWSVTVWPPGHCKEKPGVKCPTLPLPQSQHCHHFPHGSTGIWMIRVRCNRSHVWARDRDDEEGRVGSLASSSSRPRSS